MGVYPTEGNGLAATETSVMEAVAPSSTTASLTLGLPDGQIRFPLGVVERYQILVVIVVGGAVNEGKVALA